MVRFPPLVTYNSTFCDTDLLWTSLSAVALSNGGKTVNRLPNPTEEIPTYTAISGSLPLSIQPGFEVRLKTNPSRDVSYAEKTRVKTEPAYFSVGLPTAQLFLACGVGIGGSEFKGIFYDNYLTSTGCATAMDGNHRKNYIRWLEPTDRLRFVANLQTGEIRVSRIVSQDGSPEFVFSLYLHPNSIGLAQPMAVLTTGQSAEIRAVDDL